MNSRTTVLVSSSALAFAVASACLLAGPLTPPPGPITSTNKTLAEVEPRVAINATNTPGDAGTLFRITQPGSYYLTGNLTGIVGKSGIEVASSGVTLDLNGFEVIGAAGSGSQSGIFSAESHLTNVTVRNGSVRNWASSGVSLRSLGISHVVVTQLAVSGNGAAGVQTGSYSTIKDCTITSNGATGIVAGDGCTISGCTVASNDLHGLYAGAACTITNCTASQNSNVGLYVGPDSTVIGCTASGHLSYGIFAGFGTTLSSCTASSNSSGGIYADSVCTLNNCTSRANGGAGVQAGGYGRLTIFACSSNSNATFGFDLSGDSSISDSKASDNTSDGIRGTDACRVRRCAVRGISGSTSAGIHLTGTANLLEANSVNACARGIDLDGGGNKVIRNTCTANVQNWDVAGGNYCYVTIGAVSGPITGNSGGVPSGITDPNANFSY